MRRVEQFNSKARKNVDLVLELTLARVVVASEIRYCTTETRLKYLATVRHWNYVSIRFLTTWDNPMLPYRMTATASTDCGLSSSIPHARRDASVGVGHWTQNAATRTIHVGPSHKKCQCYILGPSSIKLTTGGSYGDIPCTAAKNWTKSSIDPCRLSGHR